MVAPRSFRRCAGWLAALALVPLGRAQAQDVTVRAFLSANPVAPGAPFDLNVEVVGAQRLDGDPVLPEMDFARFVSSGRTSSVQIINGVTTVSTILVFRYRSERQGTFEIPRIYIPVGGQTLSTEPLSLTVGRGAPSGAGGTASPPATPRQQPRGTQPTEPGVDANDIFITTDVNKRRVFTGEPVIVEYRIWTRVNVSQYSVTELPANTGFWAEEFPMPSPEVEQVERDGEAFATAVIRKVALFPTGPGARTIEPLKLEAQVRVRRRSNDLLSDFFSRSLLGQLESVPIESPSVTVDVTPLPDGAPREFNGFVGDLDVTASVDRLQAETNEALTLIVRVVAEGNVSALAPPDIDFPADFEVYPPEVSERIDRTGNQVRGSKTYQYVLIPRAPGTLTIPPVRMAFFNPGLATYATTESNALTLHVTGDPVEGPLIGNGVRSSIEPLREDIRFISIEVPSFQRTGRPLTDRAAFWLVLLVPVVALGGAVGVRRHQDRLTGDIAYARGRRAARQARKRLVQARALVGEDGRAFYAEVGRALQGFLGDRLNLAEAGLMTDDARARLGERGATPEAIDAYVACLAECDRQRFSPIETGSEARERFLDQAADVMSRLDGEIGR